MKNKTPFFTVQRIRELNKEIMQLTSIIQDNYPTFYSTLVETPINLKPLEEQKKHELIDYLEFLKTQLAIFEKRN